MNKKGMDMFSALDGVSDDVLMDALPPGMGAYSKQGKSRRLAGFFERPWVAAAISAAVALVVLSGIIWAGQRDGASQAGGPQDDPVINADGVGNRPSSGETYMLSEQDETVVDQLQGPVATAPTLP